MKYQKNKILLPVWGFFLASGCLFLADFYLAIPACLHQDNGMPLLRLTAIVAMVLGLTALSSAATRYFFVKKKKPITERAMVSRLYWLLGIFTCFVVIFYGLGILEFVLAGPSNNKIEIDRRHVGDS
jgi:hypothetical protein